VEMSDNEKHSSLHLKSLAAVEIFEVEPLDKKKECGRFFPGMAINLLKLFLRCGGKNKLECWYFTNQYLRREPET